MKRHPPTSWRGRLRFAAGIGSALLTVACFEPPISERMEIRFLPGNLAAVSVVVRLAPKDAFRDSPQAQQRIEKLARDLRDGSDEWSRRFGSLDSVQERIVWDLEGGELAQVNHRAVFESAESLRRFLSDTLIQARFSADADGAEISLLPGHGSRASRAQREEYQRTLDPWLTALSVYFRAGQDLYDYLDRHPDRAEACFRSVFRDLLEGTESASPPELTKEDEEVVEPFARSVEEALGIFKVPEESGYSLEELSRLVNDPFPAPLSVRVPGPVLEREGFEDRGSGWVRVPGLSLWEAFLSLEERWISPNPLAVEVQHASDKKKDFDLQEFLRRPRRASPPPTPHEIRTALEARLGAAPLYRVRWSTTGLKELEDVGSPDRLWSDPALKD